MADDVRVGLALVVEKRALPGTVVGFIALRSDDPVPAKDVEVDRQGVAAAARICIGFHAVGFGRSARTVRRLAEDLDFDVRSLKKIIKVKGGD